MLLKKGSQGEDVKKLQKALGLKYDGDFGANTEQAVKVFQQNHGLTPDGKVGKLTWAIIFEEHDTDEVVDDDDDEVSSIDDTVIVSADLNLSNLKGKVPDAVLSQIASAAAKFNISSSLRLAHFLAQCAHESGGFKRVSENLNYSAQRLRQVFPKRFPDNATANAYANNAEKIGNRIYANKIGNGDEASGDGYKFRGRGYIQLTGKSNYHDFAQFIGENTENNPDLVADKYPLASAAFFFDSHGIWNVCDQGATDDVVKKVTRCVNGGYFGLDERLKYFKTYYALLV